ncbi:MAG: inclusion body family protein [Methylovulum sp.]|nr:inclusion body family protein [Methylovulum sp.]
MPSKNKNAILMVINTESVKARYVAPSKNAGRPTSIDNSGQFMLSSGVGHISGNPVNADLAFLANKGEEVSFRAVSVYGNSDDAVILYGMKHCSGNKVFRAFKSNLVTLEGAVEPDNASDNGLPAVLESMNFASLDTKVAMPGVENLYINFALYALADDGQTQQLYGYFQWESTISVGVRQA